MILTVIRKSGIMKQIIGEGFQKASGKQISQYSITLSFGYKFHLESLFFLLGIKENENLNSLGTKTAGDIVITSTFIMGYELAEGANSIYSAMWVNHLGTFGCIKFLCTESSAFFL